MKISIIISTVIFLFSCIFFNKSKIEIAPNFVEKNCSGSAMFASCEANCPRPGSQAYCDCGWFFCECGCTSTEVIDRTKIDYTNTVFKIDKSQEKLLEKFKKLLSDKNDPVFNELLSHIDDSAKGIISKNNDLYINSVNKFNNLISSLDEKRKSDIINCFKEIGVSVKL